MIIWYFLKKLDMFYCKNVGRFAKINLHIIQKKNLENKQLLL